MADVPPLTSEEFRRLAEFLYRRTGMVFTEAKRYYVERRISEESLRIRDVSNGGTGAVEMLPGNLMFQPRRPAIPLPAAARTSLYRRCGGISAL